MEKTDVRDLDIDLSLFEIYLRMNDINGQSGNHNTSINHDSVMCHGLVTIMKETHISKGKPLPSHLQGQWYINRKLEGKQRRRRRRRQRRREQKTEQRRLQAAIEKQLPKQQQSARPQTYQRSRTWSEMSYERHFYLSHGSDEYLEENLTEALEAYNCDPMDSKARWDQEQINQLESLTVVEQQPLLTNKTR